MILQQALALDALIDFVDEHAIKRIKQFLYKSGSPPQLAILESGSTVRKGKA
jgi:hypothetical protein